MQILLLLGMFLLSVVKTIAQLIWTLIKLNLTLLSHYWKFITRVSQKAGYKKYQKVMESRLSGTDSSNLMVSNV